MSGYREPESWDKICSDRYPDDFDKELYCESHNGDMSGYQEPNWAVICVDRYRNSGDYAGESEDKITEQIAYCETHHGGYMP